MYPLGDVYKDTDGYLSHPSDDGNYALTVGTGAYQSAVDGKMYHAVADIAGEVTTQYIIRYVSDTDSAKAVPERESGGGSGQRTGTSPQGLLCGHAVAALAKRGLFPRSRPKR